MSSSKSHPDLDDSLRLDDGVSVRTRGRGAVRRAGLGGRGVGRQVLHVLLCAAAGGDGEGRRGLLRRRRRVVVVLAGVADTALAPRRDDWEDLKRKEALIDGF